MRFLQETPTPSMPPLKKRIESTAHTTAVRRRNDLICLIATSEWERMAGKWRSQKKVFSS
jgi:hypothetical protein